MAATAPTQSAPASGASVIETVVAPGGPVALVNEYISEFESIYAKAEGDVSRIPWAHEKPCPWLESWLNVEAPSLVRPGARVAVVGCGLGNDAVALLERGYEVCAFDACPSAIESARRRYPDHASCFMEADLLDLPGRLVGRFDLVVEVATIQSLPPEVAPELVRGMAALLNHRGVLLAIARGRGEGDPTDDGPPWALTSGQLASMMVAAGLEPIREVDDFLDDNKPPVRRLRGAFRRMEEQRRQAL